MILNNFEPFIETVLQKIHELNIDVSNLEMDHIGYQASSNENYDKLKNEFDTLGTLASEVLVGGRRVGIYSLHAPLRYMQYIIPAIEIVAPKDGQVCPSALEHIEFIIQEPFDAFMKRYPKIDWDQSAIHQKDFPMIKLKLDTNVQIKFHLLPVLDIVSHLQ